MSCRCMSTRRAVRVKCRNSETEEAEEETSFERSFRGFPVKRLTHAISARPSGPTLGTVAATYKEVIPGAPCSIVTALAILKHTATCKEESEKHHCESRKTRTQRRQALEFVAGQSLTPLVVRVLPDVLSCLDSVSWAKLIFPCNQMLKEADAA